jgi:hypothetical protein
MQLGFAKCDSEETPAALALQTSMSSTARRNCSEMIHRITKAADESVACCQAVYIQLRKYPIAHPANQLEQPIAM